MFRTLIAIFMTLFSVSTWAQVSGHEKGNGGYGVSCPSVDGTNVFLYDTVEAKLRYNLSVQDPRPSPYAGISLIDTALLYLNSIKNLDPNRYKKYKTWIEDFPKNARALPSAEMGPVGDIGFSILPKGCRLEQLVIQHEPVGPEDRRYLINSDLWQKMGVLDRAATMLHEVIYRDLLEINPAVRTSEKVRYLNALIFSGELGKRTPSQYRDLMKHLGFTR
ncbi:MAG: hypothetical protein JSU04_11440 [Bdellovibrionales bacterium]|nr:hypothetical protein [Bdellovibrionales bacterium]